MFNASFKIPAGYSATMTARAKAAARMGVAKGVDLALNGLRRASSRGPLFSRTGNLARSWQSTDIRVTEAGASAQILSSAPYWHIHEGGGKIVPKKGKYLTIPILDNLTGVAKVARYASVAMLKQELGADKVFVFKSKAGNLIIGTGGGKKKNAGLKAFFVLKTEVEIHATHYISDTAREVKPKVERFIAKELVNAYKA